MGLKEAKDFVEAVMRGEELFVYLDPDRIEELFIGPNEPPCLSDFFYWDLE